MNETLKQENAKLKAELEQERVRLAGCGCEALGYAKDCKKGDYGYSASLQDVRDLRLKYQALKAENFTIKKKLGKAQALSIIDEALKATSEKQYQDLLDKVTVGEIDKVVRPIFNELFETKRTYQTKDFVAIFNKSIEVIAQAIVKYLLEE